MKNPSLVFLTGGTNQSGQGGPDGLRARKPPPRLSFFECLLCFGCCEMLCFQRFSKHFDCFPLTYVSTDPAGWLASTSDACSSQNQLMVNQISRFWFSHRRKIKFICFTHGSTSKAWWKMIYLEVGTRGPR